MFCVKIKKENFKYYLHFKENIILGGINMRKKLMNNSGSKYIFLPKEVFENIDEVEYDIDTISKKIIISWE
jgi:hypothetical protein